MKGLVSVKTNVVCLRNPESAVIYGIAMGKMGPEVGEAFRDQIKDDKKTGF